MANDLIGQLSTKKRCAIYTRKSTTMGLEREFNSLDGQRALCSSYVTSQDHKGWVELAKRYDDGGVSGATLDRPALRELMHDVEEGLIDVVVVYKIDRITRTLLDFVRLLDFFGRYEVSFVSLTQNFDSTDSMGRLVLNVLLTFAQFEREIAADRVRDKILATKRSGRWAGGPAPYGYDLMRRRLHVNEQEAENVRQIFVRYQATSNLTQVYREFRDRGMRSKRWKTRAGHMFGGGPLTKSLINHILGNPVYLGEIRHKEESYPGLHSPIVDRDLFDAVQIIRRAQSLKKVHRNKDHVLTDLLFDCYGRPMSVHAWFTPNRSINVSRYYMSRQTAWGKHRQLKRLRSKADEIEQLVIATLQEFLGDPSKIRSMILASGATSKELGRYAKAGGLAARRVSQIERSRIGLVLRALIDRIELSQERVKLILRVSELDRFIRWDGIGIFKADQNSWSQSKTVLIDVPAGAVRHQRQLRLPIRPKKDAPSRHPQPGLKRLVFEAREAQRLVDSHRDKTLSEIAATIDYTAGRFARVLRLNYLAPDIITAMIDGTHPPGLTRTKLVNANLPMDWALQRRLLGFPSQIAPEGGE